MDDGFCSGLKLHVAGNKFDTPGVERRTVNRRLRIAFYSHDTMGLGHMRRNMLIAQALAYSGLDPNILLIASAKKLAQYPLPPNLDIALLPAFHKQHDGQYRSRQLDISGQELARMRADTIKSMLQNYAPDVFIVDNVARGALGELDGVLAAIKEKGHTRCVLGLRDIQDNRRISETQFQLEKDAIERYYDLIWIYGDPNIYDRAKETRFTDSVLAKLQYTGYLDQTKRLHYLGHCEQETEDLLHHEGISADKLIVCTVGGGQDGYQLAAAFAQVAFPADSQAILITGPDMPETEKRTLRGLQARNKNLVLLDYVPEPSALIKRADYVVSMGGYNSICDILSFHKPALVVPRVKPRAEQYIRANRFCEQGLLDVIHPDELTSAAIEKWLSSSIKRRDLQRTALNVNGLENILKFMGHVVRELH